MNVITAYDVPESPARTGEGEQPHVRVGAVQERWHPDPDAHRATLAAGVAAAAGEGAQLVCLMELTLSPYFAITADGPATVGREPEALPGGPTYTLATELAARHQIYVHASLWEAPDSPDPAGRAYNTAICVAPDGSLVARTRKLHIPITAGYYEDKYFLPGDTGYPVAHVAGADVAFPTCWDQWFPELARAYSLAGAQIIVYPTAIGSEPDHPQFDTQPLWQQVIVGNGIANGTFMVAVNRTGSETIGDTTIAFYGSSFISDPYGRVLVQAPRTEPAVIVADLDLAARSDWLQLFPFLTTRRPDTYAPLVEPPHLG